MKLFDRVKEFISSRTRVYCAEGSFEDDILDFSGSQQPTPPTPSKEIPSYKQIQMTALKTFTMSSKMLFCTGFKFSYMLPLSQQFLIQSEFNLTPKPQMNPQNYMQMMMMNSQREPYFTTMMNYVMGKDLHLGKKPSLTLSTRANTNGMVEFNVGKFIGPLLCKLTTIARNQGGNILPMFALELDHTTSTASHSFVATDASFEFNIFQKLGSSLYFGFEYAQQLAQNMSFMSGLIKYNRTPYETYYLGVDEMNSAINLGQTVILNRKVSVGSELELTDQGSLFSVGMKRRFGNYQLNSAINTNMDVKSSFLVKSDIWALTLYLNAKLKEEDFKTGFKMSLGPNEPGM
jgi:hypothetical protein